MNTPRLVSDVYREFGHCGNLCSDTVVTIRGGQTGEEGLSVVLQQLLSAVR